MYKWNDDYSVAVQPIDEQHKELFNIADQIHTLVNDHKEDDNYDAIIQLINELKDYTVYHFNYEEKLMEKSGVPDLDAHKEEHRTFVDYISSLDIYDIDENQDEHLLDLLKYITKWIFRHINNTDFKYKGIIQVN